MKVGIDIRMLQSSGIGTTIQGLLNNFSSEQMGKIELYGMQDMKTDKSHSFIPVSSPVYGLSQHWSYGRLLNKRNLSLFHMPHYDVPASYKGKLVVTIHDIIHYLFPEYSSKPFSKLYSSWMLNHSISRASKIICVSEHTQKDVTKHFPAAKGKTVVVHPAVGKEFQPVDQCHRKQTLDKYHLQEGYILYVGNLRPSKNTANLVEGYLNLRSQKTNLPPLVLVGKNFYSKWEKSHPGPGVRLVGSVEQEDLPSLYSAAGLFVFPSLYEGFGLPPLEALACGVPVLTTRAASLPEVCGDAAAYLEDPSADAIAKGLYKQLGTPSDSPTLKQKRLDQIKKFSWEKFAQQTWQIYEDVAGSKE